MFDPTHSAAAASLTRPTRRQSLLRPLLACAGWALLGPLQAQQAPQPAGQTTTSTATSTAKGEALRLAGALELSGAGQVAGTNFRNGVEMAVRDINASGGVLGRPLSFSVQDTQSKPDVARALVQKAVDDGAVAIFGPVFTGSMMVAMEASRTAAVPHITGAEGAAVTQQGHPSVLRTAFTQAISMPKMARYLSERSGVRKLGVLYVNNDFGRSGLEVLKKALAGSPTEVMAEVAVEQGQQDMAAAVSKLRQAQPEGLFVYTNEAESPLVLKELRKQGWTKPVYGETTLIGQKVIEQAGEAANGVIAHVGLPVEAPLAAIRDFKQRYEREFKTTPDHNSMKGYSGVYVLKAAMERAGKADRAAVVAAMKGLKVSTNRYPGVLLYTEYDQKGDLDRMSFLMEVRQGRQEVTDFLSTLNMGVNTKPAGKP